MVFRYACSLFRPRHLAVNMIIYAVSIGILALFNLAGLMHGGMFKSVTECATALFYELFVVQMLILLIWGGFNSAMALQDERADKSYDFFRLFPISAADKAWGILVGRNLVVLLMACMTAVLMLIAGAVASISLRAQALLAYGIVGFTALFWTVSLLSSTRVTPRRARMSPLGWILVVLFVFPWMMGILSASVGLAKLPEAQWTYFGIDVSAMALLGTLSLYFAAWTFTGVARLFTIERGPLFTPGGAIGFAAGECLIALGFFWHLLPDSPAALIGFWLATSIFTFFIPCGCIRTYDMYMELGRRLSQDRQLALPRLLSYASPVVWGQVWLVWAAFALLVTGRSGLPLDIATQWCICALSFVAVVLVILELYAVYEGSNSKLKFLFGFVAVLYFLLPLLIAAMTASEAPVDYSYFGFWTRCFTNVKQSPQPGYSAWGPLGMNILLTLVGGWLVCARYEQIIRERGAMQGGTMPSADAGQRAT